MMPLILALALASTPITLEEVRRLSRETNNVAQLANLDKLIADEQIRVARSAILPQLGLDARLTASIRAAQQSVQQRPLIDPANPGAPPTAFLTVISPQPTSHTQVWDLSVTLSQLIYDGGRWWNQLSQAGAQDEAAIGKSLEQQNASEFEGTRRFYELYRAQKSLDVLLAAVKRSEDQLDRANAMYEAGRLAKGDVYSAEVNLGNDQIAAARQKSQVAGAQADLAIWIARPGIEDLVATEPKEVVREPLPSVTSEKVLTIAQKSRPLLRQMEQLARASTLAVDVARSGYLPKLTGFATAGRAAPNLDFWTHRIKEQNYFQAGLTLHWDIFSGFLTDAQTAQAGYQRSQAQVNLAEATREVEGDLRRNLVNLQIQLESLAIAAKNREASVQGLIFAEERFKVGAGNTLEMRDAQLKLTQAELSQLSTRIDVEIARANLSRVIGTDITGANP